MKMKKNSMIYEDSRYKENTSECPNCDKTYEVEWPHDERFKCDCGQEGSWHPDPFEEMPLHFYWREEDE